MLAALAALHAAWATGSAWPARDRRRLAQLVAGTERMPGRAQCTSVACGLATSSALVAGLGGERSIARVARGVVCGAFLVRGGAGLTGSTQHLVSWTPAPEFVRRDRRWYSPLPRHRGGCRDHAGPYPDDLIGALYRRVPISLRICDAVQADPEARIGVLGVRLSHGE